MKKIIKHFICLSLFLTLSIVVLNTASTIKADSGWDTSYDSGGSWDSGGSSWDSGSDWGSSSWDSDSGYDGDYSSVDLQDAFYTFAFIFIIVFFSIVIVSTTTKTKNTNEIDSLKYKDLTQEEVNIIMPSLNVLEFNYQAYQMFYDIQMAWMEFDYDKLKELLTDELYNSYVMQLEVLKSKNHKNIMKEFELLESHIYNLQEENGVYIAKVYLNARFLDYVENVNTNLVVRGKIKGKVNNTYILTFICTKGKSNNINECPKCGAKVEGNVTGTCQYCKSKLINKTYNWVMSEKEKISQK